MLALRRPRPCTRGHRSDVCVGSRPARKVGGGPSARWAWVKAGLEALDL